MALLNCAKCGSKVPRNATACPNCLSPMTVPAPRGVYTARRKHLSPRKLAAIAVLIGLECLIFWRWSALNKPQNSTPNTVFAAPATAPQKVVHEMNQLKEGQSTTYYFHLDANSKVHLEVTAKPKAVDVMLMTSEQALKFRDSQGKVFGGNYNYTPTLSGQQTQNLDKSDTLPAGDWVVVLVRPKEALFFGTDTTAAMVLTIY